MIAEWGELIADAVGIVLLIVAACKWDGWVADYLDRREAIRRARQAIARDHLLQACREAEVDLYFDLWPEVPHVCR